MLFRFLFIIFILFLVEIYAFQAFKTFFKSNKALFGYAILSGLSFLYLVYSFLNFDRSVGQTKHSLFVFGMILIIYLPKIVLTLVLFIEDVYRILSGFYNYVAQESKDEFLANRRKFVSQLGLGLAAIPFLSLIYGITIGKYNYKVIKQRIFFPDLPDAFDGFTITQISDVHSGSFDNPEKIAYAVDLINQQESDLVLFTGDIVNTHAKEMHPWIETFNKIKKPAYGK